MIDNMKKGKKWTVRACIIESKKYDCLKDFRLGSNDAYKSAKSYGILGNLFSSDSNLYANQTLWNEETITREAKKYTSRTEFQKENGSAYYASKRLGLLDNLFPVVVHQKTEPKKKVGKRVQLSRSKWNDKGLVEKEAKKYESRSKFYFGSNGAYRAAKAFGMLDKLFPGRAYSIWSAERLAEESSKYKYKNDFRNGCYNGYFAAYRRGVLNDFKLEMKHNIKKTKEKEEK